MKNSIGFKIYGKIVPQGRQQFLQQLMTQQRLTAGDAYGMVNAGPASLPAADKIHQALDRDGIFNLKKSRRPGVLSNWQYWVRSSSVSQ